MQCRYTEIAQRILKYSNTLYTNLTTDKILNSLVYRMLFYVNIYGSFKLSKNSPFFLAHPVQSYRIFSYRRSIKIFNWVKKDVKVCTGKDLAGQLCKLDSEDKVVTFLNSTKQYTLTITTMKRPNVAYHRRQQSILAGFKGQHN